MAHYFRIDRRLKLIAVFSPKCASSSIHKWMDTLAHLSSDGQAGPRLNENYVIAQEFANYDDHVRVLFLRDPLRRLVSFYANWVISHPGKWDFADADRRFPLQDRSFRKFLYVLDHLKRHGLRFQHHLEPQSENLQGKSFDTVVLTENLQQGLRSLNARLGYDVEDFHEHRTTRRGPGGGCVADLSPAALAAAGIPESPWFYDDESADLARRIYADDVELYRANGGVLLEPAPRQQAR